MTQEELHQYQQKRNEIVKKYRRKRLMIVFLGLGIPAIAIAAVLAIGLGYFNNLPVSSVMVLAIVLLAFIYLQISLVRVNYRRQKALHQFEENELLKPKM